MVPIIASHRRRLLQFLVVPLLPHLHEFFSFNFQNRTCTETLLHCEVHEFSFPTSPHSPKIDSEQVCPFRPSAAICPDEFQNAQRPMFLPYLLIRVFKFIDLWCVGTGISWSFWISTFYSLYVSVHVQNLMKTAGLALELWRCWRIWFLFWSRIHGNALSCLQNNSIAQSTTKVIVGSRNNCQQTKNIP